MEAPLRTIERLLRTHGLVYGASLAEVVEELLAEGRADDRMEPVDWQFRKWLASGM